MKIGIFGQICPLDRALKEGDRVEIYRTIYPEAEFLEKKR
jgi:putative ubiquitin-RnfH superfamily antitoxin RatB of RatAB toxin-antitoxin module